MSVIKRDRLAVAAQGATRTPNARRLELHVPRHRWHHRALVTVPNPRKRQALSAQSGWIEKLSHRGRVEESLTPRRAGR